MKSEERIIKASFLAGLTDILVGLFMMITGLHEWYFEHFKLFGILGLGMVFYSLWHLYYYVTEGGLILWLNK